MINLFHTPYSRRWGHAGCFARAREAFERFRAAHSKEPWSGFDDVDDFDFSDCGARHSDYRSEYGYRSGYSGYRGDHSDDLGDHPRYRSECPDDLGEYSDDDTEEYGKSIEKCVLIQKDFPNNTAYCDAAMELVEQFLGSMGISVSALPVREGVKAFFFNHSVGNIDCETHILFEYPSNNCRIEFVVNTPTFDWRGVLVNDHIIDMNYPLRYGHWNRDQTDNELKLEHSFCFCSAFSMEAFTRYWAALESTLSIHVGEVIDMVSKRLNDEQRENVYRILDDAAACLPGVKDEDLKVLRLIESALGCGMLKTSHRKLLHYVLTRAGR